MKSVTLFTFIVLIPFQDVWLSNTVLSFAGASLSVIPLSFLILIEMSKWFFYQRYKLKPIYIAVFFYISIITILYLLIYGEFSHGENMIIKSIKILILTILFLTPIFFVDYNHNWIKYAVLISYLISCFGALLSFFVGEWIDVNPLLHATENLNMRPRGFALESTTLAAQVITLGLLAGHFFNNRIIRLIIFFSGIIVVIYSGSKGGVAVSILTLLSMFLASNKFSFIIKVFLVISSVMLYEGVEYYLAKIFTEDIDKYTSSATRLTMVIASIISTLHNPFGVGFSGYLSAISEYLPDAIGFFDMPFDYREAIAYIWSDSSKSINTKSFLFDYLLFFGWPFFIGYAIFSFKLIARTIEDGGVFLSAGVIYTIFAISTYIGGLGLYNVSLLLGVAFCKAYRKNLYSKIPYYNYVYNSKTI